MNANDEVLSVPVGDTGAYVAKYSVHACPDYYRYRNATYIAFRPTGGRMGAIWTTAARFAALPADAAAQDGLDEAQRERVRGYVAERWGEDALDETEPYRFYILETNPLVLEHQPGMERNAQGACYFTVGELTSGSAFVRVASQVQQSAIGSGEHETSTLPGVPETEEGSSILVDQSSAAQFVERLLPDAAVRQVALSFVADSIDAAVAAGAVAWNLSVREGPRLQLNVGLFSVLKVFGNRVIVGVDEPSVPTAFYGRLEAAAAGDSDYKRLSKARSLVLPIVDLATAADEIRAAHVKLVERAAPSVGKPWAWDNHYGGVTAYMREFLGRDVPDPVSYSPGADVAIEEDAPVATWIFQSNPELYDLPAALAEISEMTWVVRQHAKDIGPGDAVYLWEAGREAGILGRAMVLTEPAEIPQDGVSRRFVRKEGTFDSVEKRVRLRIDSVFNPRVSRAQLQAHPVLKDLRILLTAQGTNFKVSEEHARLLARACPSGETRYWKISPGEKAWQWSESRDKGFIAVGWEDLGDVGAMTRDEFEVKLDEAAARNPGDYSNAGAGQLWPFSNIKIGDRIVANQGLSQVLGIGTVVGPYYYVAGIRHSHRLPVRWDDVTSRRYEAGRGWQRTLLELKAEQFEEIRNATPIEGATLPAVPAETVTPEPLPTPRPEYTLASLAAETGFDEELLARWVRATDRKGQAILYGPPGTGKTFVADGLARHLAGGGHGLVEIVQFHPAYAYEDFIVGMRPKARPDGGLEYPLVDGTFVNFCDRARSLDGTSVLIVDEINRANLARVFGELMFLLEYRDRFVTLAGGRQFSIPENVRLIGTMNTADRSIALVDHALRRRFAFLELKPKYDVLRRAHAETGFAVSGLIGVLERLNAQIGDPHYSIGISFFLGPNLADDIEEIWRTEIEPYVEEYFFDRRPTLDAYRWDKVRSEIVGTGGVSS